MKTFAKILCLSLVAVMLCATLASCAPAAKAEDAVAALKDNGYTALKDDNAIPALLKLAGVNGVETVVTASKVDSDNKYQTIKIVYFGSASDAKDAEENVTKYVDEKEKDDKEKADESDWVFKRSGKMIYFGTKDAVKAAR